MIIISTTVGKNPQKKWSIPLVNERVQNAVHGCNLKNDRMISFRFQGKPFSITVIQVYGQRVKRLPTMRETQVWSLGQEDPLKKEMATHSTTLAWKIPWTEKPGRLQSMGSQRVGHDWATSLNTHLMPQPVVVKKLNSSVKYLQDLVELTPKKDVLFITGNWNEKVGSQETPGVTGKFGLGV